MYQLQLHVSSTVLRLLSKLTTCLRADNLSPRWQPVVDSSAVATHHRGPAVCEVDGEGA